MENRGRNMQCTCGMHAHTKRPDSIQLPSTMSNAIQFYSWENIIVGWEKIHYASSPERFESMSMCSVVDNIFFVIAHFLLIGKNVEKWMPVDYNINGCLRCVVAAEWWILCMCISIVRQFSTLLSMKYAIIFYLIDFCVRMHTVNEQWYVLCTYISSNSLEQIGRAFL